MTTPPLGPRFKINKTRISDEKTPGNEKKDFVPEKVIYVELDDEITNVFDAIKRVRQTRIALVIPKRATVLQSIVNLKILKKKIDELEKDILIVTSDVPGLQIAEKVGIKCTERLFEREKEALKPVPPPLMRGERPVRMSGDKVSISQVIRQEEANIVNQVITRLKERFKRKKPANETKLVFIAPNKQALFTLILVSILLLLSVAYIALPGATIYLTPKSTILDPSHNVIFLDYARNKDAIENPYTNTIIIATYPVNPPPMTKKFIRSATGKIFKGTNAQGAITVINTSNAPWELAARTRFQTDDGLIFRIDTGVRVPAARGNVPGNLDVNVVADEFDLNNQVIGSRGNILPAKFFLPGLKNEENRKKLYGESKMPMTGGLTQTTKTVNKEDIEAAREFVKKEIAKFATEDLKVYIEQQNSINKTGLTLLNDRHVISVSEPIITIPDNVLGSSAEQFEVTAQYSPSGIAFNKREMVDSLKERLISRVDPDKKVLKVEEDDISYKFLDEDKAAGKVRLTATMRAIQIYELNPEKENGHRFIKKITDHIVGMSINDAFSYLQQQTDEIARVDITTWPIWAPTIPNIADNIKFVIKEENDLR